MNRMKFDSDCGKCTEVIIDGYLVGDRLLEGLKFIVTLDKHGNPKSYC